MKVKREDLLKLWTLIGRLSFEKCHLRFHYTLLKMKREISSEVETINALTEPSEKIAAYEQERIKICSDKCEKNEDGTPKQTAQGNFVIKDELQKEFETEISALKEKHLEAIKEAEQRNRDFQKLIDEEIDIDLPSIAMSVMPEEIVGADLEVLLPFIEENE